MHASPPTRGSASPLGLSTNPEPGPAFMASGKFLSTQALHGVIWGFTQPRGPHSGWQLPGHTHQLGCAKWGQLLPFSDPTPEPHSGLHGCRCVPTLGSLGAVSCAGLFPGLAAPSLCPGFWLRWPELSGLPSAGRPGHISGRLLHTPAPHLPPWSGPRCHHPWLPWRGASVSGLCWSLVRLDWGMLAQGSSVCLSMSFGVQGTAGLLWVSENQGGSRWVPTGTA